MFKSHISSDEYGNLRTEARKWYDYFQPFPRWEYIEKTGAFALSMTICCIIVLTTLNGAFGKEKIIEQTLWVSFGVWMVMFFTYGIAKIVFRRKKTKMFRRKHPHYAHLL